MKRHHILRDWCMFNVQQLTTLSLLVLNAHTHTIPIVSPIIIIIITTTIIHSIDSNTTREPEHTTPISQSIKQS